MIDIKHQSWLKVLQKFYYSKRDISVTLVEAVFKLVFKRFSKRLQPV